jgi:hypothetical protein
VQAGDIVWVIKSMQFAANLSTNVQFAKVAKLKEICADAKTACLTVFCSLRLRLFLLAR